MAAKHGSGPRRVDGNRLAQWFFLPALGRQVGFAHTGLLLPRKLRALCLMQELRNPSSGRLAGPTGAARRCVYDEAIYVTSRPSGG